MRGARPPDFQLRWGRGNVLLIVEVKGRHHIQHGATERHAGRLEASLVVGAVKASLPGLRVDQPDARLGDVVPIFHEDRNPGVAGDETPYALRRGVRERDLVAPFHVLQHQQPAPGPVRVVLLGCVPRLLA